MKKLLIVAVALAAMLSSPADAKSRHKHRHHRHVVTVQTYAVDPGCNIIFPCEGVAPSPRGVRFANRAKFGGPVLRYTPRPAPISSFGIPQPSFGYTVARPMRYIAGRLVCAINVNAALAERGIRGTGSALAHSFDHWGHRSVPAPGAVAVTDRRGGGHVAIVSRVEGGRVFAWNPGARGQGWYEVEYTYRHARYRMAGV